jgi:hypothetical protein
MPVEFCASSRATLAPSKGYVMDPSNEAPFVLAAANKERDCAGIYSKNSRLKHQTIERNATHAVFLLERDVARQESRVTRLGRDDSGDQRRMCRLVSGRHPFSSCIAKKIELNQFNGIWLEIAPELLLSGPSDAANIWLDLILME